MANTHIGSKSSSKKEGSSSGMSRIRQKWKKVTGVIKGKTPGNPPRSPLKETYMNSSFTTPVPRTPDSTTRPAVVPTQKTSTKKVSAKSMPAKTVSAKRASTETVSSKAVPTKETSTIPASETTRKSPPPIVAPAVAIAVAPSPSAPSTPPRNSKKRSSPIKSCIGNNDDSSSEVEMVSIDLASPPRFPRKETSAPRPKSRSPSKNELESDSGRLVLRIHDKDNDANKIEGRMATKAESMMTPDMLETLGLTPVDENFVSRREYQDSDSSDRAGSDTFIPVPVPTRSRSALRSRNQQVSPPKKNKMFERRAAKKKKNVSFKFNDTASCLYYADDDDTMTKTSMASTCTTSSSSSQSQESKETCDCMTQDSCPVRDDWTYENADDESHSYVSFRRDGSSPIDCDPMSLPGMILTMPAAFGLLFVDNILNTNYVDAAIGEIPKPTNPYSMKKRKTKHFSRRDDSRDSVCGHRFLPASFEPCLVL